MKGVLIGGPMHRQVFTYHKGPVLDQVEIESKDKKTIYHYKREGSTIEISETGVSRVALYHFTGEQSAKKIRRGS